MLAAPVVRTREGLLPGVDSDMVHKFVLGFEGSALPGAVCPVAGIVCDLRPTHVVNSEVGDHVVHAVEGLLTDLLGVLVNPLAGHLGLQAGSRGSHIPVVISLYL